MGVTTVGILSTQKVGTDFDIVDRPTWRNLSSPRGNILSVSLGIFGTTRHTLAFTNNGRIYLFEDSWREHEKGGERVIRVVCEDGDPRPVDVDMNKLEFVGYSWFRDERYGGTAFIPYFRSMLTKPPEVNWERKRNPLYPVQPPH